MEKKVYVELPPFTGRNVPITEIAAAMHKDAQYVRIGLQQGILKFGYAIKLENSNEYNYYCPDRKVWEEIGLTSPALHGRGESSQIHPQQRYSQCLGLLHQHIVGRHKQYLC